MTPTGRSSPGPHGSVAEEIAALAEALRARSRGSEEPGPDPGADHDHGPGIDACEICPLCRAIAAAHTISPAAVAALADLAHQAEVTLRALASDLQTRGASPPAPPREDIPVDDLGDDRP